MAKSLTEQLKEAAELNTSLAAELNEAKGRDSELSHELGNKLQELEAAAAEKGVMQAKLDELTAALVERDAKVVELAAAVEAAKASVGLQAQEQLAKIGVPPVALGLDTPVAVSRESLMAQYEALAKTNFAAAREFWKAHEETLQDPKVLAAVQRFTK